MGGHNKIPPEAQQILINEFNHIAASYLANEQAGDARVNLFVAAAAAVLAAFGFGEKSQSLLTSVALGFLLVLGWYTLNRLVRRNLTTDDYLDKLTNLRRIFEQEFPQLAEILPFPTSRGSLVIDEEPRTDTYLVLPGSDVIGVKFREGRFEIKAQREVPQDISYLNGVTGRADAWIKFSLASPAVAGLEAAVRESRAPLVRINKRRWLQRFSLDEGAPNPTGTNARPAEGCLFELTALEVGERKFWTLGLEAFGSIDRLAASLAATAQCVFSEPFPRALRREASLSYPRWLLGIVLADHCIETAHSPSAAT